MTALNDAAHQVEDAPLVSVIIPTFRRNEHLGKAIGSIRGEGISSYEIIVIDDSPEQAARSTIEDMADPRVTYVANPDPTGGVPARVRNLGIGMALGRYLYFLDDDDQVVAGGLSAMVAALDAHPASGVAFGTVRCVGPDEAARESYRQWFDWAATQARRYRRSSRLTVGIVMFRGTVIINSCCMIRADRARQLGGYDPTIPVYEDVEFFARGIRAFGHVFVDVPVLSYNTGEPSIIHDLHGEFGPVSDSYEFMHAKYRRTNGVLDYRLLQVVSKLLPIGKAN